MFDLPGLENVEEVVVNEDAVSGDGEPLIVYAEVPEETASA